MEGSLNVDSFDKSLLFSISSTMEGSLVNLSLQIFTQIFAHKLVHRKGRGTCRSPKSYNISLDCPPCLMLFKMADTFNKHSRDISQVSGIL